MSARSIDAVKAAVSPRDFYRHELRTMPGPKRSTGWADGGLCPFHKDTHSGNFRVNLDTGAFRCFACGSRGADVLAFLMQRDGLNFPDALRTLARDWRVRL